MKCIIYTEAERDVLKVLQEKWAQHNNMVENMTVIIRKVWPEPHPDGRRVDPQHRRGPHPG